MTGITEKILQRLLGLTTSTSISRNAREQALADAEAANLSLYYFPSCPYCIWVLREIQRLAIQIELHNIHQSHEAYLALVAGGGKRQVPCLRIQSADAAVYWLYESRDIIDYLREQFMPLQPSRASES